MSGKWGMEADQIASPRKWWGGGEGRGGRGGEGGEV